MAGLRQTLADLPGLRQVAPYGTPLLDHCTADLTPDPAVGELLLRAVAEEPAVLLREGGVIATGYDADLDELRAIGQNCDAFLLDLETRERQRTGIANLRVQFNKVHGFYIEVTASGLDKVPADYQRRQTLKNAERYITPELKTFEDKALSAQDRALAREKWLFEQLLDQLQAHLRPLDGAGPCVGHARRAGRPGRTGANPGLVPTRICQSPGHRDRGRAPPGGRGPPGRDRRRRLHCQRLPGSTPEPGC